MISHRIKPLHHTNLRTLSRVVAYIKDNYLDDTWGGRLNKGSFTLHNHEKSRKHEVITLFFDYGNNCKNALGNPASGDDLLAVAIELGSFIPVIQDALRDWLQQSFGANYSDPRRKGTEQLRILPHKSPPHIFDVVFLERIHCDGSPSFDDIFTEIQKQLPDVQTNDNSVTIF